MTKRLLFLAFILLWPIFWLPASHAEDNPAADEALLFSTFFSAKTSELERLDREATLLHERFLRHMETLEPVLAQTQNGLQMIDVMSRMAKYNPNDMRVALVEAKYLQTTLIKENQPLVELSDEVGDLLAMVQSLAKDVERKWVSGLEKNLRQDVLAIRKDALALERQLTALGDDAEKHQARVAELEKNIQTWITRFETELPKIWKAEFFESQKFRLLPPEGSDMRKDLSDWLGTMRNFFSSQYRSSGKAGDWVGTLLLFWLPFLGIGVAAYRFLAGTFSNNHAGGKASAAFGIFCLSLGLTLLAAFLSAKVKQTSLLLVCTHLLMLLGLQTLAWIFRNVRGVLTQPSRQPLLPLVFLSLSVAILDFLRLPGWIEHLSWVGLLVLSSLFFGLTRPTLRFERLIRKLHPSVTAILVAIAILGWGNLAILASTLWGVLALATQMGLGASSVIGVSIEKFDKTGLRALVADLAGTFLTLLAWAAMLVGVMLWVTISFGTSAVFDRLSTLEFNWGDFSFNFMRIAVVLLLFQVVRSLALAWKAVLDSERLRGKTIDHGAAASLQRIGVYCLWLLYGLVSLNLLGISLANFAVIAGGLSVGIGFGMQTMISNFISGLILLFDRSIQPGDVIELNGLWAKVESVNIRNTLVRTFDNAKIFVPNSDLIANQVTNWTHRNDVRIRQDVAVGVAYGSDVAEVKRLLREAAEEHPAVLSKPEPWVIFTNFGGSSLDFVVRFWVRHVDLGISACSEIREAIDAKFREHGVEIPFPQMDLHMRHGDGTLRVDAAKGRS